MRNPLIIDSHCHINFPQFNSDRGDALSRAGRSGVSEIITSGITTTFEGAVILHARDAEEKALKIVENCDSVVFHCYGGSIETMNEILDHGFYISLATLVCFSQHHRDLAREVPLDRLLVETDSPYLSPRRGRNEPAFIVDAITTIANIKETNFEKIAQKTTENARKIFNI
ncbi:hypothetical protein B6V01_000300 [Methanosarcinales archaeon ex4572_44]|nr:MAG: hypothetical protein B6V01_000300 [Methanosarcinales archaeon ex4572_44]